MVAKTAAVKAPPRRWHCGFCNDGRCHRCPGSARNSGDRATACACSEDGHPRNRYQADRRAQAQARALAGARLAVHLMKAGELAGRGNIPAARMVLEDAGADLNDIERLISEEDGE